MTNTNKVIGFLDIFGAWDPDLLFVMASAVAVTAIGFALVLKRRSPLIAQNFAIPVATMLDKKLIGGAVLFGVGWGLFGYCPGPAIAALIYLTPITWVFVITMLIGMFIGHYLSASKS